MSINWNCDGAEPHTRGEVRVYPLGSGGNLILCKTCFDRENRYRAIRTRETSQDWPQHEWQDAEIYR